jgi:NADH-ubiquinone oxidoreductase chain 2
MSENTRPLQSKNYYTNFTAERLLNVISTKNYPREYSLITLISTLGAMLLISSCDLISLYICIELQSFGVYILATIYKNSRSAVSAGLKYFLLGSLSSCIILLGSSLIYTYTGLTNLDSIYSFISVTENTGVIQGISLGIVLMFIGFFFKIGAAPLHN